MQSIKEHNLKANHNTIDSPFILIASVCNLSKNTIWKQITTCSCKSKRATTLYAIYQRTQSESKSQQADWRDDRRCFCMQSIKEHNLKANHNFTRLIMKADDSVCNLSKNTIWKQITTSIRLHSFRPFLYAIYQRTQSESKSQLRKFTFFCTSFCMQSIKEHNLKANHNHLSRNNLTPSSVCNLSKNTIWKQITT